VSLHSFKLLDIYQPFAYMKWKGENPIKEVSIRQWMIKFEELINFKI
jgi:hypothetical protein